MYITTEARSSKFFPAQKIVQKVIPSPKTRNPPKFPANRLIQPPYNVKYASYEHADRLEKKLSTWRLF